MVKEINIINTNIENIRSQKNEVQSVLKEFEKNIKERLDSVLENVKQ